MMRIFFALLLISLVSCNANQRTEFNADRQDTPVAMLPSQTVPIPQLTTNTPSDQYKPTRLPTLTPTSLLQSQQTVEPTTIVAETTPEPTLTEFQREEEIQNFLAGNRDCLLPCYWGIVPGLTGWETTELELSRLGIAITSTGGTHYGKFTLNRGEKTLHITQMFFEKEGFIQAIYSSVIESDEKQLLFDGEIYKVGFEDYQLTEILSTNGLPNRVEIQIYPWATEMGETPYYLLVRYDHLGMIFLYDGYDLWRDDEVRICPNETTVQAFFWSPGVSNNNVVETNLKYFMLNDLDALQSLEDAAGISIESFDQQFRQINPDACFSVLRR